MGLEFINCAMEILLELRYKALRNGITKPFRWKLETHLEKEALERALTFAQTWCLFPPPPRNSKMEARVCFFVV